ncbi:hypothetical protein D3C78_815940 [compost metagenome]
MYQTTAWPAVPPSSDMMTTLRLSQRAKDSVSGALEALPSALMRRNTGDSLSCRRMYTETISRITESRKGIRQPQASNASVPSSERQARITSSDMNRPRVAVVWIQEVKKPRLPLGACSAT